ncbi:Phoxous domain [Trinorchestia longiramus]|nr:Phoxous domain [Trinorchestia longiramus]
MALLDDDNMLTVEIPSVSTVSDFTEYNIMVHIGAVQWLVRHRYKDFQSLHQHLTANHGIAKHLLPPKKIIGNKDPSFIQKRRIDLQTYIQGLVTLMQRAVADELAEFLQLAEYEVLHLRRRLASDQRLVSHHKQVHLTALEMHAISATEVRGSQPPPGGVHHLAQLAEAAGRTRCLTVTGSSRTWRESNIVPNELDFNFNMFKKLHTLNLEQCNVLKINDASSLRRSLVKLNAPGCGLQRVCDLLLCDAVHRYFTEEDLELLQTLPKWAPLKDLNLSNNAIASIDLSVSLCHKLETINLSGNKLSSLDYLTKLPYLISVVASNNSIIELPDLHTKLGNLVHLDLSRNKMNSLVGLACLYSLVSLDVSSNLISDIEEVEHVSKLPCLEDVVLTGNPVATIVDYRTKVLECFGIRCSELCLDLERPTQRELDKVAVLQALRSAKESNVSKLPALSMMSPVLPSHVTAPSAVLMPVPDLATAVEEATKLE